MTEEQDFIDGLDADPDNHLLRAIYADWLGDRGDPRAEGYRALAVNRRYPEDNDGPCPFWAIASNTPPDASRALPDDWYNALEFPGKSVICCPAWSRNTAATRQELEDAAALSFGKLPPERQRELLTVPVLV